MNNRQIGLIGEQYATEFLESREYLILERNFRTKLGEIDIIARKAEYLVIIEVKSRKTLQYGFPCEAVNYAKQNKIKQVTNLYLSWNNMSNDLVRFDIIEVLLDHKCNPISIELIENAFE